MQDKEDLIVIIGFIYFISGLKGKFTIRCQYEGQIPPTTKLNNAKKLQSQCPVHYFNYITTYIIHFHKIHTPAFHIAISINSLLPPGYNQPINILNSTRKQYINTEKQR